MSRCTPLNVANPPPPIFLPGTPILVDKEGFEQMGIPEIPLVPSYENVATIMFNSYCEGTIIRIHHIKNPFLEKAIDYLMEKEDDRWQLYVVEYEIGGECPKPYDFCATDIIQLVARNVPNIDEVRSIFVLAEGMHHSVDTESDSDEQVDFYDFP